MGFASGQAVASGRPGDWNCPSCGFINFSSKTACSSCGLDRPADVQRLGLKTGDWICPACGDVVFASKDQCKMCGTGRPEGAGITQEEALASGGGGKGGGGGKSRPGDW